MASSNKSISTHSHKTAGRAKNAAILFGILAATILLTELLRYYLDFADQNLVLIYVLSVLIISCISSGYLYGLIAAVVSALVCDFLIVTPRLGFSFTIGSPITLLTLLIITTITSTLASRLREQKKLALRQQNRFELLYEINRKLLSARSIGAIVDLITESIEARTGRPVIVYTADPLVHREQFRLRLDEPETAPLFINESELQKVHDIFSNPLPEDSDEGDVYYLPIISSGGVTGVIGIHCGKDSLSQDELAHASTLAVQVSLAFDLQILSDRQENLTVSIEKEKIRSTLLRAISHDFRTPLATIRGACSAMLEDPELPLETREKLLGDMLGYSDWLTRMVENILTATKIAGEITRTDKKEEAAEEVVSYAVSIVRKRYGGCNIRIKVPDELLIVPMDGGLIAQVLVNLLENAILHSESEAPVLVELKRQGSYARFDVVDHGRGIPQHLIDSLFGASSPPEKQKSDSLRGAGLGLSICKTIIDAHKGTIDIQKAQEDGFVFSFLLPLEENEDAI